MFRGCRDEGLAVLQSCSLAVNTIAYCLLPAAFQIANRKFCLPLLLHPAARLDAPHQFADEGGGALAGSIDVGRNTVFIERFAD